MAAVAFTTPAPLCARPSPHRNADADAFWAEVLATLAASAAYVVVIPQFSAERWAGLARRGFSFLLGLTAISAGLAASVAWAEPEAVNRSWPWRLTCWQAGQVVINLSGIIRPPFDPTGPEFLMADGSWAQMFGVSKGDGLCLLRQTKEGTSPPNP
ncbi:hypothetical protein WCLP8_2160010 [uncultured Gammaproteobacteria bacterium]